LSISFICEVKIGIPTLQGKKLHLKKKGLLEHAPHGTVPKGPCPNTNYFVSDHGFGHASHSTPKHQHTCCIHGPPMCALCAQGHTQFCSAQWPRSFKWKYIPLNSWGFTVFSWTFLGHSTRAFIAPCLRPRKGPRIRGK